MALPDPDDSKVTYTVKELLGNISNAVARVELAMTGKADKTDIERIERRLDKHQQEIDALKSAKHDEKIITTTVETTKHEAAKRRLTKMERAWAILLGLATLCAAWTAALGATHVI